MPSPADVGLGRHDSRRLRALAWGNAAVHAAGLAAAWWGLRPGSVVAPLAERIAYVASRTAAWSWGWRIWMLCSLLLVAFVAALGRRPPLAASGSGGSGAARLALVLTASGVAVDLLCDVLQIRVLPLAAAAGPSAAKSFLAIERLTFLGGATVANGLYTAGVFLLTRRLGARLSAPARLAGWATVAAGCAMAAAGLLASPWLLQAATGPTIGGYSLWAVLVARNLTTPSCRSRRGASGATRASRG